MKRARKGQAIRPERRTRAERRRLQELFEKAERRGDLKTWRRAKCVLGYLAGKSVTEMAAEFGLVRASINRWLGWFNAEGTDGLKPRKAPGPAPRLTAEQHAELETVIEAGPQAAGYSTGMWTGPMIGDLIHRRYGVRYHNQSVPRLLHNLGFSVQRPRKRLARADLEKQARWLKRRFPAIKKKRPPAEASFYSRTKPASGSTVLCTAPGPALAASLVSTPMASEKLLTSMEP
jgi:transposase